VALSTIKQTNINLKTNTNLIYHTFTGNTRREWKERQEKCGEEWCF